MNTQPSTHLPSFDTLLSMAQNDPQGLETLRRELCEQVINRARESSQPRLKGLLWRIDSEIRRNRPPLAICLTLHRMMLDSLFELEATFNNTKSHFKPLNGQQQVVPFKPS